MSTAKDLKGVSRLSIFRCTAAIYLLRSYAAHPYEDSRNHKNDEAADDPKGYRKGRVRRALRDSLVLHAEGVVERKNRRGVGRQGGRRRWGCRGPGRRMGLGHEVDKFLFCRPLNMEKASLHWKKKMNLGMKVWGYWALLALFSFCSKGNELAAIDLKANISLLDPLPTLVAKTSLSF